MNYKAKIISYLKQLWENPTVTNILTVAIIAIGVKGLGFYKEIVIASTFGLSELLDTFYIAALVPGFISQVFLSAFKSVFIPNYVAEQKTSKQIGAFQATSFLVTIVTAVLFIFISYLVTDVFLETFFSGHTESYYTLIKLQFRYLVPCILFWGLSSLLAGLLNIHDEFRYSSIYPVLTSIVIIVCLLFFSNTLGEAVLAIGTLIGSILQFLFLLFVAISKKIIHVKSPDFKSENAITMFQQVPAKISSGFLTGLIPVTDQYFAAQLIIGSIAALNYGLRIPAFITTIILLALGNVLLPYFSKLSIDNKEEAFRKLYFILKRLFIALIIVCVLLMSCSEYIIQFFFERDQFTAKDTQIVSDIMCMFLIGIPFTVCGNIIVRFLTSINKNVFMAYISFVTVILNIILDIIFMNYYGILGIDLCTAFLQIFRSLIYLKYTSKQYKLLRSQ